tara:strand:- start:239 stop:373 length:135 start_codon:yes stop_codon:yes gene_type:complete
MNGPPSSLDVLMLWEYTNNRENYVQILQEHEDACDLIMMYDSGA